MELTKLQDEIKRANKQLDRVRKQWRRNPTQANFEKFDKAETKRDQLEEEYEARTVGL